ncbi:unnamed protein product [Symbiodinium sp. CCMP2592]|nr:unnamed protein product [Symbiodinium sp. CCMP2592]
MLYERAFVSLDVANGHIQSTSGPSQSLPSEARLAHEPEKSSPGARPSEEDTSEGLPFGTWAFDSSFDVWEFTSSLNVAWTSMVEF